MTLDEYVDRAKEVRGFASDRALARDLDVSHNLISQYRTKRAWPSDKLMVKLAHLADVDPEIALLDLCQWRAEGEARGFYEHILKLIEDSKSGANAAAIALLFLTGALFVSPAQAEQSVNKSPRNISLYTLCD